MRRFLCVAVLASMAACAPQEANVESLQALLEAEKFAPTVFYAGPEDKAEMVALVDDAIQDIIALPEPRGPETARERLRLAVSAANYFVTEDREEVHKYIVRIWRASGQETESGLFPVADAVVLGHSS